MEPPPQISNKRIREEDLSGNVVATRAEIFDWLQTVSSSSGVPPSVRSRASHARQALDLAYGPSTTELWPDELKIFLRGFGNLKEHPFLALPFTLDVYSANMPVTKDNLLKKGITHLGVALNCLHQFVSNYSALASCSTPLAQAVCMFLTVAVVRQFTALGKDNRVYSMSFEETDFVVEEITINTLRTALQSIPLLLPPKRYYTSLMECVELWTSEPFVAHEKTGKMTHVHGVYTGWDIGNLPSFKPVRQSADVLFNHVIINYWNWHHTLISPAGQVFFESVPSPITYNPEWVRHVVNSNKNMRAHELAAVLPVSYAQRFAALPLCIGTPVPVTHHWDPSLLDMHRIRKILVFLAKFAEEPAELHSLLCWIAFVVRFPSMPMLLVLYITGYKGTGKTLLATLISNLVGSRNAAFLRPHDMVSRFTEWRRFLFLDECAAYGPEHRETVKRLAGADRATVERKYQSARSVRMASCIYMSDNSGTADGMEHGEGENRRLFLLESHEAGNDYLRSSGLFDSDPLAEISSMVHDTNFVDEFRFFLRCYDMGTWSPYYKVPTRAEFRRMAKEELRKSRLLMSWAHLVFGPPLQSTVASAFVNSWRQGDNVLYVSTAADAMGHPPSALGSVFAFLSQYHTLNVQEKKGRSIIPPIEDCRADLESKHKGIRTVICGVTDYGFLPPTHTMFYPRLVSPYSVAPDKDNEAQVHMLHETADFISQLRRDARWRTD